MDMDVLESITPGQAGKRIFSLYRRIFIFLVVAVILISFLPAFSRDFSPAISGLPFVVVVFIFSRLFAVYFPELKSLKFATPADALRALDASAYYSAFGEKVSAVYDEQGGKLYCFQVNLIESHLYAQRDSFSL